MVDSRLLVGLVISLLVSSLVISLITGAEGATLGDVNLYPPLSIDFSDVNVTAPEAVKDYQVVVGGWVASPEGLVSSQESENLIYLLELSESKSRYDNTYWVNTGDIESYKIIVRDTSLWSDSIRLRIEPDIIVCESKSLFGNYAYQVAVPVNVWSYGHEYSIRTILDEEKQTLDVYLNDIYVAHFEGLAEDSALSFGPSTYAGISVEGAGFVFKGFGSTAQRLETESSFDFWTFLESLTGVLTWYTGTGVPLVDLFVNLIIKVQQFGIVVVIITIIRGA